MGAGFRGGSDDKLLSLQTQIKKIITQLSPVSKLYYLPGTYTGTDWQCAGYLTGSAKTARLIVFPERSLAACASVKVTAVTGASIRVADGDYIGGSGSQDLTSYIASSAKRGGTIIVDLTNSSGWGFTNNSTISGQLTVTFTVT